MPAPTDPRDPSCSKPFLPVILCLLVLAPLVLLRILGEVETAPSSTPGVSTGRGGSAARGVPPRTGRADSPVTPAVDRASVSEDSEPRERSGAASAEEGVTVRVTDMRGVPIRGAAVVPISNDNAWSHLRYVPHTTMEFWGRTRLTGEDGTVRLTPDKGAYLRNRGGSFLVCADGFAAAYFSTWRRDPEADPSVMDVRLEPGWTLQGWICGLPPELLPYAEITCSPRCPQELEDRRLEEVERSAAEEERLKEEIFQATTFCDPDGSRRPFAQVSLKIGPDGSFRFPCAPRSGMLVSFFDRTDQYGCELVYAPAHSPPIRLDLQPLSEPRGLVEFRCTGGQLLRYDSVQFQRLEPPPKRPRRWIEFGPDGESPTEILVPVESQDGWEDEEGREGWWADRFDMTWNPDAKYIFRGEGRDYEAFSYPFVEGAGEPESDMSPSPREVYAVLPSRYRVLIHPERGSGRNGTRASARSEYAVLEVTVKPGQSQTIDPPFSVAGILRGRVIAESDGATISRARVTLVDAGSLQKNLLSAQSDWYGRFEISGIIPGRWEFEVLPEESSWQGTRVSIMVTGGRPTGPIDIRLPKAPPSPDESARWPPDYSSPVEPLAPLPPGGEE